MPSILLLAITGPAASYILLVFGFLALLMVDLLLGLVEGVVLTLLSWNPTRTCMKVSFIMNLVSGVVNGILLVLLQSNPLIWLPISFVISLLVEGFILDYFKRDSLRKNSLFVFIANLSSYLLLILPAYYFSSHP
jgi:predicted membrane channel-forming protein YqfA (hemolysin III family)